MSVTRHLHAKKSSGRQQQRGFSLLESMLAVVILSIGLLGIAGLQTTALKSTRNTSLRTQAILLSYSILESMHANRKQTSKGAYTLKRGSELSSPSADCQQQNCSPKQMAQYDVFNWWQKIRNTQNSSTNKSTFPKGDCEINLSDHGLVTVSISWQESWQAQASQAATLTRFSTTAIF